MPSSVWRSIRISGQSVMVAMRAVTGRFSLRTTGRALMLLKVSDSDRMRALPGKPAGSSETASHSDVNSLPGILSASGDAAWHDRRHRHRQRILDAAYGLFWRQGFVRVSMDQIADRAKVTKRTLYQHFRSKDDLIAAALAHSSELALERLEQFRPAGEPRCDDRFLFRAARGLGGETAMVRRRFHARRGRTRGPARSSGPRNRAPPQGGGGSLVCGPARDSEGVVTARAGARDHAADGRRDDADAHSRRPRLCGRRGAGGEAACAGELNAPK